MIECDLCKNELNQTSDMVNVNDIYQPAAIREILGEKEIYHICHGCHKHIWDSCDGILRETFWNQLNLVRLRK